MKTLNLLRCLAVFVCAASPSFAAPAAAPPSGSWDATVHVGDVDIPFRFELSVKGPSAAGAFFNGDERVRSSQGQFSDGTLALRFEHYASALLAQWTNGQLTGSYERPGSRYAFQATPHVADAPPASPAPPIDGQWDIAVQSPKGESAWRF